MSAPGNRGTRWRLSAIGALAVGVTAAIYLAGRLIQPNYTFSLFGADPIPGKSAPTSSTAPPGSALARPRNVFDLDF